jgi:hypothetical protein
VGLLEEVPGAEATAALLPALADEAAPVRARAREVLHARTGDGDLAAMAGEGLRRPEAEVRRRCAEALRDARARAAPHGKALAALLRDRDGGVREAAAAALGAAGDRGRAEDVAAAFQRESLPEARGALLLALGALDPEGGRLQAARAAGRERDGPTAVAALRVLGGLDPAGAASAAGLLLRHPAWEARLEACRTLASRGDGPAAVDALLGALGKERRVRVREGIGEALERLSGVPLGTDEARWKAWWGRNREGWKPGRAPDPVVRAPAEGRETAARFYDIPVDGDRVVFVLDTSRSMLDPARLGEEATKMQLAVAQFAKTLAGLGEDVCFNVVAFGTEVEAWRPRAVPATPTSRYEALRFLQKRAPEGRTNIHDALAAALADLEVDTVFLLTDGAPTAGEETTRTGFLRALAHLRRWRPVRVHCVEVGAQNTGVRWKGFLAEVASSTGGVHVSR